MIPKSVLAHLVEKQNKAQEERLPGLTRHLLHEIPYLSDRALLLGGLRVAGRSTLLWQLRRSEYAQAWYINLEDPRLAGFDAGDFEKLTRLIAESGRGVVLFDKIDRAEGWLPFVCELLDGGIKVIATVSFDTLQQLRQAQYLRLHGTHAAFSNPRRGGRRSLAASTSPSGRSRTMQRAVTSSTSRPMHRHPSALPSEARLAVETTSGPSQSPFEAFCDRFILIRVPLFSYSEFLEIQHKRPSASAVQEYLQRGAFPELQKNTRQTALFDLYETILNRDVLLAKGIRDQETLRRLALRLIVSSGEKVTANALRNELRIKAVTTVTEHMEHLERAGLLSFVPYWSENPAQRAINPRKVYAADTALITALNPHPYPLHARCFETALYHHLAHRYEELFYTSEAGGCDFIVREEGRPILCVQTCYEAEDPDRLQQKSEGLLRALEITQAPRGILVTPSPIDFAFDSETNLEVTDADTFLSE